MSSLRMWRNWKYLLGFSNLYKRTLKIGTYDWSFLFGWTIFTDFVFKFRICSLNHESSWSTTKSSFMKPLFMHKHAQLSSCEKLVCLVHFVDRELSITVLETEVVWFLLHTYWHLNLFCFLNLHHIEVQLFITLGIFFPISLKVRNQNP